MPSGLWTSPSLKGFRFARLFGFSPRGTFHFHISLPVQILRLRRKFWLQSHFRQALEGHGDVLWLDLHCVSVPEFALWSSSFRSASESFLFIASRVEAAVRVARLAIEFQLGPSRARL